jgi:hypothetical protein
MLILKNWIIFLDILILKKRWQYDGGDDNKPLTDSEKLDIICNSVKNLIQNYNDLTKKVDNMQSKFDLKIENLKQEMNLKEN